MRHSLQIRSLLLLAFFSILSSAVLSSRAAAQTYFAAFLLPSEEHPHAPVGAIGYGTFKLSADHTQLSYEITAWGLSGDIMSAHIHLGKRGMPGTTLRNLTFDENRACSGVWTNKDTSTALTPAIVDSLFAGKVYVNIHTMLNPDGEIRGQLFMPQQTYFAHATNSQAGTPDSKSTAAAFFTYDPIDTLVFYRGQSSLLSSPIMNGSIRQDDSTTNGIPLLTTVFDTTEYSTYDYWTTASVPPFSSAVAERLSNGGLYWNIPSKNYPGGELRGKIGNGFLAPQDSNGMYFMAMLSGPQEGAQPVPSTAVGTGFFYLSPDYQRLSGLILFRGLGSSIEDGHIHHGIVGHSNGIVVEVTADSSSATVQWTSEDVGAPLSPAWVDSLFDGTLYVNIHSFKFPDGEIRGQIIPLSQRSVALNRVAAVADQFELQQNYPNPFNPTTELRYTLDHASEVTLAIYDQLGNMIQSIHKNNEAAGAHAVRVDLSGYPSGVYYAALKDDSRSTRIKMALIK